MAQDDTSLQRAHAHVLHGYARLIELTAASVAESGLQTLEDADRFVATVRRHLNGADHTVESLRELVIRAQRAATERPPAPSVEPQEHDRCERCGLTLGYFAHGDGTTTRACGRCDDVGEEG